MPSAALQLEFDFYPRRARSTLDRHADPDPKRRRRLEGRRDRLMGRVTTLRAELARLSDEVDESSRRAAALIDPVRERLQEALSTALGTFEKLLGPGSRLERGEKRALHQVFESVTSALVEKIDALPDLEVRRPRRARSRGGGETEEGSIGTLFKQLAVVLHPDHAPDDAERQRRHSIMREVTQAYAQKDLARLLELKAQLGRGVVRLGEEGLNVEGRLRRLAATNRLLERQQQSLRRRVLAVRQQRWGHVDASGAFVPNPALQNALEGSLGVIEGLAEIEALLGRFVKGELGLVEMLLGLPESLVSLDELAEG